MIDKYADVNVSILQSDILSCKEDIQNLNKLVENNDISTSLNNSIWDSQSKTKFLPFIEDIKTDYKDIFVKLNELEVTIYSIKEYKSLVQEYNNLSIKIDNLEKAKEENKNNKDFNREYNYNQIKYSKESLNNISNKINNLIRLIEG